MRINQYGSNTVLRDYQVLLLPPGNYHTRYISTFLPVYGFYSFTFVKACGLPVTILV
jgi:hypothetical protein